MVRKFLQGFAAGCVLLLLCGSGWTANQRLSGEYKTIQQIEDLDVVYFPRKFSSTQTVREVHSKDSSTAVTYASFARKTGVGMGKFVLFSRVFPAGKDTVYVGDIGYSFSGGAQGLDSIIVSDLDGSTFQIEGAK